MAEYDLISKTALLKHLDMAVECKDCPRNGNKELYKCVHNPTLERCTCSDIAQICIRITEFATFSDVQPVKRGEWAWNSEPIFGNPYGSYECSECKNRVDLKYNYCCSCGAEMKNAE